MMKTIAHFKLLTVLVFLFLAISGCAQLPVDEEPEQPHHIVVLGDPHIPGRDIEKKSRVVQTINSWDDVEMVIAVGDICSEFGTDEEYWEAKKFFGKLHAPFYPIAGNHDYFYADPDLSGGQLSAGSEESQQEKLARFYTTFDLKNYYYSKFVGDYLIIFLSADHSTFLSGMSNKELTWLRTELSSNKMSPTIIVFHGPLHNTLRDYRKFINTPNFIAQPEETIREIIKENKQVFLWISGHTHTSPLEESFASPINVYEGQVTNIHNKDLNRYPIWTNSLYLYSDRVEVKSYNHEENVWVPQLDRTIPRPRLD